MRSLCMRCRRSCPPLEAPVLSAELVWSEAQGWFAVELLSVVLASLLGPRWLCKQNEESHYCVCHWRIRLLMLSTNHPVPGYVGHPGKLARTALRSESQYGPCHQTLNVPCLSKRIPWMDQECKTLKLTGPNGISYQPLPAASSLFQTLCEKQYVKERKCALSGALVVSGGCVAAGISEV